MSARLLFVSNGIGEDLIAARIIAAVPTAAAASPARGPSSAGAGGISVTAYPLVGLGAYPAHIPLLDPRRDLPSGGFSLRTGLRKLGADLSSGMVKHWLEQRRALAAQRGRFDLAVAVGDVYCLWMACLAAPRAALVATADSVRTGAFGPPARWVLRRHAEAVFARDPETAAALSAMGLPARWEGNVMMDLLEYAGDTFGLAPETPVVTLLPGSRRDSPDNAGLLGRTVEAVAREAPDARFLLALAPGIPAASVQERMVFPLVQLTRSFADAVNRACVVVGMAGTANEQAAGLGKPVVVFPGAGAQFGPGFLRTQHRLLGEAVVPARDWREAADAVVRLLRDPSERDRRGSVGRQHMGPPGGADRIASALLQMI